MQLHNNGCNFRCGTSDISDVLSCNKWGGDSFWDVLAPRFFSFLLDLNPYTRVYPECEPRLTNCVSKCRMQRRDLNLKPFPTTQVFDIGSEAFRTGGARRLSQCDALRTKAERGSTGAAVASLLDDLSDAQTMAAMMTEMSGYGDEVRTSKGGTHS